MQNLPKKKIVKPKSIRAYENGQIPEHLLVECGFGPNHKMVNPAARAMKALIKFYATHPDNIEISTTGCYRSYNAQVKLFLERFTLEKTDGIMKAFSGKNYYLKNLQHPGNQIMVGVLHVILRSNIKANIFRSLRYSFNCSLRRQPILGSVLSSMMSHGTGCILQAIKFHLL